MLDRRALFSLVLGCISPAVLAAQELAGTWFTNRGVLEVKADGEGWSATYGNGSTLTAEKKGDDIVFTAKEGRAKVTGSWQFQKGGFRFDGDWQSTSGNGNGKGEWFGWRHDPATEKGKPANLAGFWRTSWGLLEIEQKGSKLTGGFGAQGWSTFEGAVRGRFAELDYESPFGTGTFRIDFDEDGKLALGGAENTRGKYALQLQRWKKG